MRLTLTVLAALAAVPASADAATVSVYPVPGMVTATKETQISFRGTTRLGTVVVTGSRSGRHRGRVLRHSDGEGASFVPNRDFVPGERVTVRSRARDYAFRVGRRPPLSPTRPAERAGEGAGEVRRFVTRPDLLPPAAVVSIRRPGRAPGFVFLGAKSGHGQDGPMILDDRGRLVWFRAMRDRELATDFRAQTYQGKPVLTWWQGRLVGGDGRGEGVIYDENYRPLRRVRMGNGLHADLHEFELTPQGTALLIAYDAVVRPEGRLLQAVVQEVDIETGLVLFEWHSIGNIALSETYRADPGGRGRWDYMHLNSVALDTHGDFIISARSTRAVYRIARATGRVVWRLGGRRSDFRMGPGAQFALQHDARPQPDGTITIYDNSATPAVRKHSRAITLTLDEQRRTATLKQALVHPLGLLSATQGGAQTLPGGNTFVGWGSKRWFSEFDASGRLVFDGRLAAGNDSYRAYRFPWAGRPDVPPKAVRKGANVYVSWNGATNVAAWQVVGGATVPSAGFETAIAVAGTGRVVVNALDANGAVLATSST